MTSDSKESVDIRNTDEKYDFEEKEYKVQKVFWALTVTFLAAGLLGVFGEGVLSNARVEEDEFYIEYERILRDETATDFSVYIKRSSGSNITIAVGKDFVEKVKIEGVVPQPASVEAKDNQMIYTFNAASSGLITFNIMPQYVGAISLELTIQGQTKHLNQFVFF